jgi:hypothetical protein
MAVRTGWRSGLRTLRCRHRVGLCCLAGVDWTGLDWTGWVAWETSLEGMRNGGRKLVLAGSRIGRKPATTGLPHFIRQDTNPENHQPSSDTKTTQHYTLATPLLQDILHNHYISTRVSQSIDPSKHP